MPRPRKSLTAARLTGALAKNPQRYRTRSEPLVAEPLGDPPHWLTPAQASAWRVLEADLPWLNSSHRGITGIAAFLVASLMAGELCVSGMKLLHTTLNQLCATPATAHKVAMVAEEDDDLLD